MQLLQRGPTSRRDELFDHFVSEARLLDAARHVDAEGRTWRMALAMLSTFNPPARITRRPRQPAAASW
jgi:hypothetical protein